MKNETIKYHGYTVHKTMQYVISTRYFLTKDEIAHLKQLATLEEREEFLRDKSNFRWVGDTDMIDMNETFAS